MNDTKELVAVHCEVEFDQAAEQSLQARKLTLNLEDSGPLKEMLTACKAVGKAARKPKFMLYLVGLNEAGPSLDADRVARIEQGLALLPLSKRVGFVSRDPEFWRYLESVDILAGSHQIDENVAKQYIYWICRIESRRQIDHIDAAAERYLKLVEKPFTTWLKGQQGLSHSLPFVAEPSTV